MNEITNVGINISEKATLIWNVADMLRGPFKPHEYGLVILPMTVVKRFHDCLLPTHAKVLETYEKVKMLEVVDGFLTRASGYQFYKRNFFVWNGYPEIEYVNHLMAHSWGQKVVRFYDLDGNLIEVGTPI